MATRPTLCAVTTAVAVHFDVPGSRADELAGRAGEVRFVSLAPRPCVMVDGSGPPGEAAFAPRMPGLYGTAYGLRFALKRRGIVERVGPLEGLWWTSDGTTDLDEIFRRLAEGERTTWRWTLLMGLPEQATAAELAAALATGRAKIAPALAGDLRIETLAEGRVAQLLHVGPYAAERASLDVLHAQITAAGLRPRGRHHEIYLGDPRRTAPERLRTILRQPVS
jgi:hypothetical protein